MKKISLEQLRPGMRLAQAVLSAEGNTLLRAGVRVRPAYLQRLRDMGFTSVFISEPGLDDVVVPEPIRTQTRLEAMRVLKEVFRQAQNRHAIDTKGVLVAAQAIVEDVLGDNDILIHLGDIRSHDDYTFAHSVHVGALCTLIGRGMGYPPAALRELAIGGLLHDVGKVFIPESILNKQTPLTAEEVALIREHPRDGFDILRGRPGIPLRSAHMAYQHHELLNGTGYPRGLKGDEIHPYARINAVADVFDALTADRPYRKGASPLKALRILQQGENRLYDGKVLAVLRSYVAIYPVGTRVRLNTGQGAVVVAVRRRAQDRPRVRIVEEADGRRLEPPYEEVDLLVRRDLSIVESDEP